MNNKKPIAAEGGNDVSRRLKRLIEEEERTTAKIEELQEHLKEIKIARKQEEDQEIVRSIRTMKLGARELFSLLSGIQDGSVSIETLPVVEDEETDEADQTIGIRSEEERSENNQNENGAEEAPESEDITHE